MEQINLIDAKLKNPTSGCKGTVASFVIGLLQEGKLSPKEIAEQARTKFGGKTSEKCVYWYASKMKINLKDRPKAAKPRVSPLVVDFNYQTGMVA